MNAFVVSFGPIHVIDHADLDALTAAVDDYPQFAGGLLVSIKDVFACKQNRRQGLDLQQQPPEDAIDPNEDSVDIGEALLLRASRAADG